MPHSIFTLTQNPFQENTYILPAPSGRCIVIDPGCMENHEQKELKSLIEENHLTPARLINTHCHIDHILGNRFVADTYGLGQEMHELDMPVFRAGPSVAAMYGMPYKPSPEPAAFLVEGDVVELDGLSFEILFTPGHSPGSICLYNAKEGYVIAGDVLFRESIGRTDLPGGDHATLIESIRTRLLVLPKDTVVYPGHGPETTIGYEIMFNPFLQG